MATSPACLNLRIIIGARPGNVRKYALHSPIGTASISRHDGVPITLNSASSSFLVLVNASPGSGVIDGKSRTAKSGAIRSLVLCVDPTYEMRDSSSPKIHPKPHMSTASVYPPLDSTTSGAR